MTETNKKNVSWGGEIWAGFIRTKNWSSKLNVSRENLTLITISVPSIVSPTTIDRVVPLNSVTSSALSSVLWLAGSGGEGKVNALDNIDPLLEQFWLRVSCTCCDENAAGEK